MADIFSKIIKDYNNELEKILEKKDFDEIVKNLLLSMLYKIEYSYDDYKKVKVNVCSKEQFIEELLDVIENKCNKIEIINPISEEGENLQRQGELCQVDKENGTIRTFQNERSILDALTKIKQEDIRLDTKYLPSNKALKEMLLIGNNMNVLELLSDFNGWSWDIGVNGKKHIAYNNLYQLLVILLGDEELEKWINKRHILEENEMPSNVIISSKYNEKFGITKKEITGEDIDYISEIRKKFRERYGYELEKEFFNKLVKIAIFECAKYDNEYKDIVRERQKEIIDKLDEMSDNKTFVENLSKKKKEDTKFIEEIDLLLSNPADLKKEYEERNDKLPNKEKIFSVSHFEIALQKERRDKLKEIKDINKLMEPNEFVKVKSDLEETYDFYNDISIGELSNENMERLEQEIEKTFLKCFDKKIEDSEGSTNIENLLYELRYYKLLPSRALRGEINFVDIEKKLIKKACENKILTQFSDNDETNYMILKEIFNSRIIDLNTMVFVLKYHKGILTIKIFDANTDDEIKQLVLTEKIELKVKLNKKIKIWQ